MPDRPKRRKNKNKRKNNKNTDVNKINVDESETIGQSCSNIIEQINKDNVEEAKVEIEATSEINSPLSPIPKTDTVQQSKQINEDNEAIQICSASDSAHDVSSANQQGKELDKIIITTTDICADINNKYLINNKQDNEEASSEVCAVSMKSPIDVEHITEQIEETLQTYIVEIPEKPTKTRCKLDNGMKSKSCDNDDCPTIVEITDDSNVHNENENSLSIIDNSNVIISGEESDIEWEKVDHFNLPQTNLIKGVLSSDTIPLNIVHCEQIKSLSPQEELSLRNYLQTLNLSTTPTSFNTGDIKTEIEQIINQEIKYRLRKKGQAEDNLFIRAGPSRSLAVIDEEGSGDSSKTSRRHSYLSDKKSDNEELEDDVFESKQTNSIKYSNIGFATNHSSNRLIPQPCIRVDAKLKEPEISEARGDWSMKTVERMTGAELIYLTDSSSSTSSIYDINDESDKGEETDVTVRMITPTIEVTDTESLLCNTFLSNIDTENINKSLENINEVNNNDDTSLTDNISNNNEQNKIEIDSNLQSDSHEIVILSTDNINTNLIVKDIHESTSQESDQLSQNIIHEDNTSKIPSKSPKDIDEYDLEIKVLKCELNDAINNLIKEVISDSESTKDPAREPFTRQDSSSSVDSSQCTAKYNPTNSSLNDVSNILQDDVNDNINKENMQTNSISSHVKEVLQCITSKPPPISKKINDENYKQPSTLRDICLIKINSFPYGEKILEELAHVSQRLQSMSALASERNQIVKNQTPITGSEVNAEQFESNKLSDNKRLLHNDNNHTPPPILPRKSSLKISQDEQIKSVASKPVYECLSPSQKMLMEKTNTNITKDFTSQPNVNTTCSNISTQSESKLNRSNISSSISPMKSETGSRLLALLRDTSISNNLNTQSLEDTNLSYETKMKPPSSKIFSKRLLDEIDSTQDFKNTINNTRSFSSHSSNKLKPVLPPKPRKISTYCYESDEGSNFRENSFQTMSSKKYFHYSTGNLCKEIENDISSIQNMHRYCTNLRDQSNDTSSYTPRRPSLPKDLCDQQMEYIRQKEKEVDAELRRLEQEKHKLNRIRGPRAPMVSENESNFSEIFDSQTKSYINKDLTSTSQTLKNIGKNKLSSLFSSSQEELLREKMYSEYINQMAEREQRKQQRIIKVTQTPHNSNIISKSMPLLDNLDSKTNNRIEEEFISKARERWYKLGIRDPETEDEKEIDSDLYKEPKVIEHKIKVIEAGKEKDVKKLPSHMQEFVKFTVKDKEDHTGSTGESDSEKASAHVVVFCAVVILVLTVGKFLLQLFRNK